jgi:hypothetical protein
VQDNSILDWDGIKPIFVDFTGEDKYDFTGDDIAAVYLAKDTQNLYVRMTLTESPNTLSPDANGGSMHYFVQLARYGTTSASSDRYFGVKFDSGNWRVMVHKNSGQQVFGDHPIGFAQAVGTDLEWKVPLNELELPFSGCYLNTWSHWAPGSYDPSDSNNTGQRVGPSATVTGTLTVPNYSGAGPIYIQAYRYNSSFKPDPMNKLGGQVIFSGNYTAGMTYAVNNLPVGARIFLFVHWDQDINGIISPGDYTNFYLPLTTVAGNNSLDLATNDAHSSFPPPEFTWVGLFSLKNAGGFTSIRPGALISGPSPEDVTITMQGPGGLFSFTPLKYSHGKVLYYGAATEPSYLPNGNYTFEAVDSLGRRATPVTYNYVYNGTLPFVETDTRTPANRAFVGTTTPTLSWQAPAGGPYYYRLIIEDLSGYDFWYDSGIQTATSLTIPSGVLQPNTPYRWYVRVFDSAAHPMNIRGQRKRRQ